MEDRSAVELFKILRDIRNALYTLVFVGCTFLLTGITVAIVLAVLFVFD